MIRLISARKAPPTRGAVWRSLLALLLVVIASQSIGAPLWMGNDKEMLRVEASSGQITGRVSLSDIKQFAHTSDGSVWALDGPLLVYVDSAAQTSASIDVANLGYGEGVHLAVDPFDDSVWVITTQRLLGHFDKTGRLQIGYTLPGPASAIGVALDQTCLDRRRGRALALLVAGTLVDTRIYGSEWTQPVTSVAVDSLHSRLWLVGRSAVGTLMLDSSSPSASKVVDIGAIRDGVIDPKTGLLWILTDANLLAYDGDTTLVASVDSERARPCGCSVSRV